MATKKQLEKPTLFIAYWYRNGDEMDACIFIGEGKLKDTVEIDAEQQFLKYAKRQGWTVDKEDIEGVYTCTQEEDIFGRDFTISVKLKN